MDNKNTSSSQTPSKESFKRKPSKIDIKQMCQKFERLSSMEDESSNCLNDNVSLHERKKSLDNSWKRSSAGLPSLSSVPKAPARKFRNKNRNEENSWNTVGTKNSLEIVCDSMKDIGCDKFITNSSEPSKKMSVRERMKMFESVSQNPNRNSEIAVIGDMSTNNMNAKKVETDITITPPSKPPRSANIQNPPKLIDKITNTSRKNSIIRKNSLNLESAVKEKNANICTSTSSDVSITESTKWEPEKSTPKTTALTSKTVAFKNYLKNLSMSAVQLREKVKNKSINVFIDLTPTTVSPPKRYGTLKRSHSEEHIYAEPYEEMSTKEKSSLSPNKPDNSLHYMCTPIFQTEIPENHSPNRKSVPAGEVANKESRFKKSSVRNGIYESFSMLRRPARFEGDESNERNGAEGDSESDVSVKDVQERIIYVKSVKKAISVSSICIAPKLFEAVLIINIADDGPDVIFKYPKMIKKGFDYPLIPHLCFPDYQCLEMANIYKCEMFHFTLVTNDDEEKVFGYCHRILGWPEQKKGFCYKFPLAICILSSISAPLFYKKILVEIEKHMVLPIKECTEYLSSLRKFGVPNAGASVSIPDDTEKEPVRVVVTRPLDSHTIGIDLTRTLQLLDVDLMVKAVSCLLLERRVLLLSHNSWNVLHCSAAISSLLYPFQWQHLLIPILPSCLMVQCCTESPYLLGVVSHDYSAILDLLSEHQVLIIDIDKGAVLKSFGDDDTILPKKVQKAVIGALNLAKNMTDPTEMMRDVMISEAAVHMFVEMLGHVKNHIVTQSDSLTFQKDAFQKHGPSKSIQSFLQWFTETQMFDAFIEEYIWRINYRKICQSQQLTLFEKRVEEYKWELAYDNDKISKKIGKTVRNIGEKLKSLAKS